MQEFYTIQVLDEPGTLLINGEECRILLDEEVILIDNLTRKQQFAAWPFILADQPSSSIFPPGFWHPGDSMRSAHGRWFNLSDPKLGHHPLALFAFHLERNWLSAQLIEAGSFQLEYPFYASSNHANL